ncbi:MAG: DNA polymerase III subunit gamma/tau [Candidatus Delongbacteria bacterium]|jgi:DNA polymerase-3 subunit gamma/tau|nr:DNA polymerase III subunit gamma/tau [Candidatus Delongbacteria bacterium]
MSYLVIARKYRPLNFEDVIGQEHVTTTLINAINNNKVHHAYIFTGPRGVGKTTVSRILAKALNCETGITPKPCGVCKNCKEIDLGNSLDVKEIDGASNRGIDEIRDLRDDIKFAPASCRKKIYIIDEVHMLTNQAFNALLKTLEEPPEHAIFIFATTEINEVPATILSRCQRHDFKRVSSGINSESLKNICTAEGVEIDEESLLLISKSGDGSVRDSQSILDQVIAYCGNNITIDQASEALGIPKIDIYFDLLDIVNEKNTGKLVEYIENISTDGINFVSYIKGLLEFFRNMLIIQTTNNESLIDLTTDSINKLKKYCAIYSDKDILFFLDLISKSNSKLKSSPFIRIDFEIILLKILHYDPVSKIDDILNKLSAVSGDFPIDIGEIMSKISIPAKSDSSVINTEVSKVVPEDKKKTPEPIEISESANEVIEEIAPERVVQEETPAKVVKEDSTIPTLNISTVIIKWENFVKNVSDNMPNIGNMLYYSMPVVLNDNILEIKFDPKHKIQRNLCETKIKEITNEFNSFFGVKNTKLKINEEIVNDNERILKIKNDHKKTQEEKKKELLEISPELKFLFDDPFNCKFID